MDFKEVCCNIRSCLNSSKSQLSLTQLNRDYNDVLGENIPFRKVGYSSLEALLRDVPNLRISSIRGELFIDVKPDEKTAHIASLVREQRVAKKKKRKSSRGGFYRGSAPPPRRPAPMPPSRRSNPPPQRSYDRQQSDYRRNVPNQTYGPDQRRESQNGLARTRYSPPEQSHQNQRRHSPPRHSDDYYSRRRDASPPPSSYSNHRNSAPVVISSDEDDHIERLTRKYRAHPSQYDFSDSNEFDDYGSDFDDCEEINSQMEELKVTLGKQRREVSIDKPKYRSNTSNEDDFGYQSMNEIAAPASEPQPAEVSSKGKGDSNANSISKMNVARGPAALLAAGRAMKEPAKSTKVDIAIQKPKPVTVSLNSNKVQHRESNQTYHSPMHNIIKHYLNKNSSTHGDTMQPILPTSNREAFKIVNKSQTAMLSKQRLSPTMSPVHKANPNAPAAMSKMSDTNMFKIGPHIPPDLSKGTYCGKLHDFAMQHSLHPPQYKTFVKFCPKSKAASYMCKIKIGSSLSFTSCPYEHSIVKEVQEYTAKIAHEELQKRYENLDTTILPVTSDENLIIKRIAEIVNPHSSGLKSDTLESKYKLVHQQILPIDWLDIIKNRSLLSVEELMEGVIAVYPVEGGMNTHLDVSKLPPLVLPENEVWNVYVTCCMSTSCVYFRIIHDDYNGLYAVMDEKMHELYESKRESKELRNVEMVKEGSFYAAYLDNVWFRVKALSTIIDDVVRVCLIDHGDIDEIGKEELFPLDERFTNLPPQKVSCSLTGLENYSKEPYVTRIVSEVICGKAFVAKVDTRNPSLQLTLLDTSTEADINVNELIIERIEKELEPPKIPSQSNVTDAYLVSVKEDGIAFVQVYSESFKLLKSFLDEASEELASNLDKYRVQSTNELLGNKIFLAKYASDGLWYRVVIDRVVRDDHIEVLFVDYGNMDVVALKDIADVDHFTEALSIMPYQAVQVRLVKPTEELFTENMLQLLMDLSSPKESPEPVRFLLKTVKEGAIPDVYLFYRVPDTNQLVNVNDLLASYFPDLRGPNYVGVPLSNVESMSITSSLIRQTDVVKKPKKIKSKSNSEETLEKVYPIPPYAVPLSDAFSVYVTMVSSPSNFILTPEAGAMELAKLKTAMNEFYNKEEPFIDVSKIKENEAYAVKNSSDGVWYRGVVVKMMSTFDTITVRLVDYGDIITITHSSIAHLLPCFRSLPRQAIKAELAGVTPVHSDWCVDDSLRFKQLVSEKLLTSAVVETSENGKISVILFDTSTVDVIDVGAVLVHEGRAKDVTEGC